MSEELADELEAINSIYGDGSLVQAGEDSDIYILTLPDETVSLRLQFPADYPDAPPSVIRTNSSGGKRGVGARDLELFRNALGNVYQPGQVCLFDAVEELKRLQEEAGLDRASSPDAKEAQDETQATTGSNEDQHILGREPPWVLSDPVIELKSVFIARCAAVTSPEEAAAYVEHLLASDKKVRTATHNITAWRIRGPNGTSFQDCDDDGETAAGSRLLHLMQLMDLWDTMVVVTRWYGGHHLGPRRFALINIVARDAFVKAGLVHEPTGQVDEVEKDGHQLGLHRPQQRIAKGVHQAFVEQKRRLIVLCQSDREESGSADQGCDQTGIEFRVDLVHPGFPVVAVPIPVVGPGRPGVAFVMRHVLPRALDEAQIGLDTRDNIVLLQQLEGPDAQLGDVDRGRAGRRPVGLLAEADGVGQCAERDEGGAAALRALEPPVEQHLHHLLAVPARDYDEVRVIGGYEEDGDAGEPQGRRQVDDATARVHAGRRHPEDEVGLLGHGDGPGGLLGQLVDDGLEELLGPGLVAGYRALDGRHADVEEAVLLVDGEALEPALERGAAIVQARGQEDADDGLDELRVEVQRDVYQAEGFALSPPLSLFGQSGHGSLGFYTAEASCGREARDWQSFA
ncbi:hypothetical protein VPNG_05661 [Cytospora leucostoma]|uniref:RWD domain-containing protein n=1 Tax=Cytospora leucostoma TaxID=1230097 RepID=A0A423X7F7_9PEZI|nr:hypothetical protein VPNG_05661 [Cytospora leucostoma]